MDESIELIDKNTQNFLKNKYHVTFYDTLPEIKTKRFNDNPIIQRINKMYQGKLLDDKKLYDYEPFQILNEEGKKELRPLSNGKIITNNNSIIYNIKKGEYIYKGTREFITVETEDKFLKNSDPIQPYWFGSALLGYLYSQTYNGGLNSYKLKNDTNLFIINDIRNEKIIINFINNLNESELKIIGFPKHEILESVRIKYGFDCTIGYQIKYIEKYNKFPDLWLSRYINKSKVFPDIFKYRNKRVFGAGKLDRTFGRFMCYFCSKNNYNGYCSIMNYSIFYSVGILGDEIIICDQEKNLKRDINDPLDWYQWKHLLNLDIDNSVFKNYLFSTVYHNKGFINVYKQYYENQLDNKRNKNILKIIKDTKPIFKFITLNVHSFISSNSNDTYEIVINKMKELLNIFNVDFCFLEEYSSYVNDEYIASIFNDYNILKSQNLGNKYDKYFGNVLLSKDKIKKFQFNFLSAHKGTKRVALNFEIDNKNVEGIVFCGTHLEIGERYTERKGSFKSHEQIIDIYNDNVNKRISELNKIINTKPDIILGDFNFTKDDLEFNHISKSYTDTIKEEYPTLFNNERVDFIFNNKVKNIKCDSYVISYPYSDHLPVIGLIY